MDPERITRRPRSRHAIASLATVLLAGCLTGYGVEAPPANPGCRSAGAETAAVSWHLPAAPADVARLDHWCAAVGAPVVIGTPERAVSAAADSLAIISWNTKVGGGDIIGLVTDLRAGRLTGGRPVEHFVLLLQEVHRESAGLTGAVSRWAVPARVEEDPPTGRRRDVVESARELGLALYYVPSMRNGFAGSAPEEEDRGNAILSTLPLTMPRAIELPFEAQRRVAAAAVVRGVSDDGAPWELLVTSAHFDTRSAGTRIWASGGAGRRRQAEGLVAGLPGYAATVVAGDLNTWSLAVLESAVPYLRTVFPQTPPAPGQATFAGPLGYRRRLDRMFFRLPEGWSARYARVDGRYGSDHHPLLGWVMTGPTGPTRSQASAAR